MAYFSPQYSSGSPVMTMSPQPAHQHPFGMPNFPHHNAPSRSFGASIQASRPAAAGRKRSRDEASVNLEPEAPPAPQEPEEEWVYGEGMTLIKPSSRYVCDATTQSGTWLEEKKATEEATLRDQLSMVRNHKLQRRACRQDGSSLASASASPSFKSAPTSASSDGLSAPVIDNFTLHLGIGWRKLSDDEHIQAAARGWARYIENHYALSNARVLLESKGLESYLVEASEGFFLFAENLRQGQLVSQTADGALLNLQGATPKFDGMDVLSAAESPKPVETVHDTEMRLD